MDVTALGLSVDTSGLANAEEKLDAIAVAAQHTASATDKMEKQFDAMVTTLGVTSGAMSGVLAELKLMNAVTADNAAAAARAADAQAAQSASLREAAKAARESAEANRIATRAQREIEKAARDASSALERQQAIENAAIKTKNDFIELLRREVQTYGMSKTELLSYKAAQLGVSEESNELLHRLNSLDQGLHAKKEADKAAAQASRDHAAAMRQIDQAARSQQKALDDANAALQREADGERRALKIKEDFIAALYKEAATFGMTRTELLAYNAAQMGMTKEAGPMIAHLAAQEQALVETKERDKSASLAAAAAQKADTDAKRAAEKVTRDLKNAERERVSELERVASTQKRAKMEAESFIQAIKKEGDTYRMTRIELLEYEAAQRGLTAQAAPMIARLREVEAGLGRVGNSAKQNAHAMRMVGPQITDVFTQLAGGQNPLLIMVQQGGQLRDMFGGFGPMLKHLGSMFTFLRVAIGGVIAVMSVFLIGIVKGHEESQEYNKSLLMTGNYAGLTTRMLADMAVQMDKGNMTQGKAAETLALIASTGRVAGNQIQMLSQAAIDWERATGTAVEETIKHYVALADRPTAAAAELNKTYHFLTSAVYEQITALERQGKIEEAGIVAQKAYADALTARANQVITGLGTMERAWIKVKDAAKGAWDSILNVGREQGTQQKIAELQKQIDALPDAKLASRGGKSETTLNKERQLLVDQMDALKKSSALEAERANNAGIATRNTEAGVIAIAAIVKETDSAATKQEKMTKEVKLMREHFANLRTDNPNSALLKTEETVIANIKKKYEEKSRASGQKDTTISDIQARIEVEQALADQLDKTTLRIREMNQGEKDAEKWTQRALTLKDAKARAIAEEAAVLSILLGRQMEANRLMKETIDLQTKEFENQSKAADAANKKAEAAENELANFGLSKEALLDDTILRKENLRAYLEQSDKAIPGYVAALDTEIVALKRLQAAQAGINQKKQEVFDKDSADAAQLAAAKELDKYLDPKRAQDFGKALGDSFGKAGKALATLLDSMQQYASTQTAVEKERKQIAIAYPKDLKKQAEVSAELDAKMAASRIDSYAAMAGAAKNFFKEGSKGYKAMEAAEKAFRAFELGLALFNMLKKVGFTQAETVAVVVGEGAKAVAVQSAAMGTIATNAVVAESNAVVAMTSQATADPYSAFFRMAAMAAALAALGVMVAGGQKDPGSRSKERQAAMGTGTVFGDDTAKSSSIDNSLARLQESAKIELGVQNNMLIALRSIDQAMSGLANIILRTSGLTTGKNMGIATGVLSKNKGDPLMNAVGTPWVDKSISTLPGLSGIVGKIQSWWGKVKQEIGDTGLMISGMVKDLEQGMGVSQFADVLTTTSSWFGLSKDSSWSTQMQDVDQNIAKQFGMIFSGVSNALEFAAAGLGRDTTSIGDKIANFVVDIPRASLKGLTGTDLSDAIQNMISAAADKVTEAVLPGLDEFQQIGEGYFETVIRVAAGVDEAKYALEKLGISAVSFTMLVNKQGDIAAEIVRQSLVNRETRSFDTNTGMEGRMNWRGDADRSGVVEVITGVGKIMQAFEGNAEELASLYQTLMDLRDVMRSVGTSTESLSAAMIRGAGGLEALQSGLDAYFDKYFTEEEKHAANLTLMTERFVELGVVMPKTMADFRKLVESVDENSESGQTLYGQLMALAGGFAELNEQTAQAVDLTGLLRAAREQEIYILQLLGQDAQALAMQREDEIAAMDESLRPRQEYIYSLEDEIKARDLANAAAAAAQAERARIESQNMNLLLQLWQAEGNVARIREHELKQLDVTGQAMQTRIWQIQDEAAANAIAAAEYARAAAAQEALQQKQMSILLQLWQAEGNVAAIRAHELKGLDEVSAAMQKRIWAIQDEAVAAAEYAAAAAEYAAKLKAISDERYSIEGDILALQENVAAIRARELAQLDPSNRALKEYYYTLVDQKKAADEAADAAKKLIDSWKKITDSLIEEVKRIRGEISMQGPNALSTLQTQFATATAQARAGDQTAAGSLPDISKAMLDLAANSVSSRADLVRLQALTAGSLEQTAQIIGNKIGYDPNSDDTTAIAAAMANQQIQPTALGTSATVFNSASMQTATVAEDQPAEAVEELKGLRSEQKQIGLQVQQNTLNIYKLLRRFQVDGLPVTAVGGSSLGSSNGCCDETTGDYLLPVVDGVVSDNPLLAATLTVVTEGTGTAYTTNTAGYAAGATVITLITGTGTVLVDDVVMFAGDPNKYTVEVGIAAPGAITLASPGLRVAIAASATAMTLQELDVTTYEYLLVN